MNLKYFILAVLILWQSTAFSQDFNELKNQEITFETLSEENIDLFLENIHSFIGDDFDSLDIKLFFNLELFGAVMIENSINQESLTYGDLYAKFLELKELQGYVSAREEALAITELVKRPADFNNWEKDKELFIKIGFDGESLEAIRLHVKEISNPDLSYETVINEYFESYIDEYDEEYNEEYDEATTSNIAELENSFSTSKLFNEEEVLAQSKRENKPILLYFTGYNCVNCRKIEYLVLTDPKIAEALTQEYILVPLFVDDRTELPLEEQKEVKIGQKIKAQKMVGDKHAFYQFNRFKVSAQPYFVVLNSENKVIETADYNTKSIPDFLYFLNNSIKKFREIK